MQNHFVQHQISYETAASAVAIAMEVAEQHGVNAVVAVANASMNLVAFGASDGATPHSAETCRRKAATAASTRKRTSQMAEPLRLSLPLGTGGVLTAIDGGFPLSFDGVHVGGIGVAGGTPAQDAEVAVEVLRVLGADPVT